MKFIPDPAQRLLMAHLRKRDTVDKRALGLVGMGLGKTGAGLSVLDELLMLGDSRGALVVAPMRVANLTWPNEVEKWDHTAQMRIANLRTREGMKALEQGTAQLYTCNYEMLPKLCDTYFDKRDRLSIDTIIFDEITKVKNPKGKRANQLRKHLHKIPRRWGFTGTPKPNSSLELFGQVRILDDGKRFGPSFDAFKRTYFYPTDYMEYDWEPFEGAEEKIYTKIADLAITLKTEDFSDVPAPHVEDVYIHLPDEAKEQYGVLEDELVLFLNKDKDAVVAQSAGVLVNKLLQVTGGAVYATVDGAPSRTVLPIHNAKIEALVKLAKHHKGQPMLIACNYQHEQERILRALPGARLWPKKDNEQQAFLAAWSAGKIPYVVADPRSIGHGLNLQEGGKIIVWFSIPWSREIYDQFIARLVRRGQSETVTVYRILCSGTVDDAVAETLRQRDEGQRAMLDTLTNYRRMLEAA